MFDLYLITKPVLNLEEIVLQAINGGVSMVQLRDKHCSDQELIDLARRMQHLLPSTIPLIINDRLNVAKAVGAGIHVGMDDASPEEARAHLGERALIGMTIHDRVDLAIKYRHCIDYVGVGPIFETQTKKDAKKTIGPQRLFDIVEKCPVPVVAIGGINGKNVSVVRKQGTAGIAVCAAIMDSTDPKSMALRLR